ncbi:hypothetical protein N7454_001195 [Penicillium verhagenii]|nr:hypothetical protein N7454_001195 [Penicillium verhagenii]
MPQSPTTTSSSMEAGPTSEGQTNSTPDSSTRLPRRGSRIRASFQKSQSRDDEWSQGGGESPFSFTGWLRSLRSKRKDKADELDARNSGVGSRSDSPPRLPELGLDGARLELLAEETGFSGQQR